MSSQPANKPAPKGAAAPRDPLLGVPLRSVVREAVGRALRRAIASGAAPAPDDAAALELLIAGIEIEVPANETYGDYASNIAMKSSKLLKRAPAQIAAAIAAELTAEAGELDLGVFLQAGQHRGVGREAEARVVEIGPGDAAAAHEVGETLHGGLVGLHLGLLRIDVAQHALVIHLHGAQI